MLEIVTQQIDMYNGWPYVFPRVPEELLNKCSSLKLIHNDLTHNVETTTHRIASLRRVYVFLHDEVDDWSREFWQWRKAWEGSHPQPDGVEVDVPDVRTLVV
jgi:hypothetical protein